MSEANGSAITRASFGTKRLMLEAKELARPTAEFSAFPLEDNLYEWHFTMRGPPETEYEGGVYHGRIVLPHEYPMKPPHIIMLTPNGRFEVNTKICLSISGYHPETWLPSWSIRTAIMALISFFPTDNGGELGAISWSKEKRKDYAKKSLDYVCPTCGLKNCDALPETDEVEEVVEAPEAVLPSASGDHAPTPERRPSTPAAAVPPQPALQTATVSRPAGPHCLMTLCALGICISFAAFMGLVARRLSI